MQYSNQPGVWYETRLATSQTRRAFSSSPRDEFLNTLRGRSLKKRRVLSVVFTLVFFFVLWIPSPLSAKKITILYSNATFSGTALFVAKDAGLCAAAGIELELVLGSGSAPTVSAIVGGHVQFVQASASSILNAALQGGPVVIVAKVMGPPPYKLVGGLLVRTLAGLKGKKVGVNRFGGAPDFLLRYVLVKNGFEIPRDVTILQTGDPAVRLTSLFTGALDASMLQVPEEKVAAEKGYPVLVDFGRLPLNYVNIVLAAHKRFVEENPDLVRSFLACYREGVRKAKSDAEFTKKSLARWTRTTDPSLLEYTYELWRTDYAPESLKLDSKELDLLLESGPKPGSRIDPSQLLDMRYLP